MGTRKGKLNNLLESHPASRHRLRTRVDDDFVRPGGRDESLNTRLSQVDQMIGLNQSVTVGVNRATQVGVIDSTIVGDTHVVMVSPPGVIYTRRLTAVWLAFFLGNAGISLYTTLFASLDTWALYNGFVSYGLTALLIVGEYPVRRRYQRLHHVAP